MYNSFLGEIVQKIPQKIDVVNTLADMLCLAKEAVYRRLRKEVPFTFYEVMTISRQLGISLDNLEMDNSPKTQPFRLKLIEYMDPQESDFAMMEDIIAIMKSCKDCPDAHAGEVTNILPQPLYVYYEHVFRFYLLKWKYQSNRSEHAVPYRDIAVPEQLQRVQEEYGGWTKHIHRDYVFDRMLFRDFVTNVEYFHCIGLITRDEVMSIMDDLLRILDEIDYLSRTGTFRETGKKVDIYISGVNVETSYVYVSAPDCRLTIIKAFLLNGIVSSDRATFEEAKLWMHSLQKQSVLITGSGEKERIGFLEEQHKIVESLSRL